MSSEESPETNAQKPIKFDRLKFSASEDNVMLKQIEATDEPDGRDFDINPLLRLVKQIFKCATFGSLDLKTHDHVEAFEEETHQAGFVSTSEALAFTIERISCEIRYKCSGGGKNAHENAISLLNMVSSYPWDAKLVLILSAFSLNYGEFWLFLLSYNSNQLAKSMAVLKQVPEILGRSSKLKPHFISIQDLIKAMTDVTNCIVEFRELPSQYLTDIPAFSTTLAHIPTAVYWTIRCIVACALQIDRLRALRGDENPRSISEAWEISALVHKLSNIHNLLSDKLDDCHKHIDDKRHLEDYQMLSELFNTFHTDNSKVLQALIYKRDNQPPLFHGTTGRQVGIDVLKDTHVLLLISDLDISHDELEVLEDIYRESLKKPDIHYEIVWLPILDHSDPWMQGSQKLFENHQARMIWYSRHDPLRSSVREDSAVVTFIKEEWHYGRRPIVVALDPQGELVCQNALHMMWIWKNEAFPFSTSREEALWAEATWNLDLLVNGIDPLISEWIAAERAICLYGGDDIEWIKRIAGTTKKVAESAGISLEMVYMGKSNPKQQVRANLEAIHEGNLSHPLKGQLTSIWYFWVRLESMLYSKLQLGQTVESDPIMQQVLKLLSFNSSHKGWVLLSKGSEEIVKARGDLFSTCLSDYEQGKVQVQQKDFLQALKDHLLQIPDSHHCNQFEFHVAAGIIPEIQVCSECGKKMEKFIAYRCCDS